MVLSECVVALVSSSDSVTGSLPFLLIRLGPGVSESESMGAKWRKVSVVCLVVLVGGEASSGTREFLISALRSDIQLAAAAACLLRSACSRLRVIVRSAHFPAVSSQRSFLWSECFSRSASGSVNRTSRSSASPVLVVLLGPVLLVVFLLCVSSL